MKKLIALPLIALALGACGSTAGTGSSAPHGIDQAIWDDYCRHGAKLVDYLDGYVKGTQTADETVSKLNGSQDGIQGDADATSGAQKATFQAIADAVGRAKVAVSDGTFDTSSLSDIMDAASALPKC